ncbi:TetR/AcrR family transcriptional regulator [Nocardia sp. 2]|uniref:TetR/AcrR family transcriptional regulator n=1 Tax=Nocardia acididurans TaxID=2802282 RepID=A0ABS1M873_9NOCA|nr:TetR/AcrR family transcriptional regulator [Nocardia acididurans]MBL1076843.1 TetR/AcrR family transcriptional regulator [Nocardia acididurans]
MARPRQFSEADLLDAATELFWTKGFDSTSVEDVSRASGIGNGSIYGAYGSKRGLFLAVFERYCDGRTRFIRDTLAAAPGSARTGIQVLLRAVIDDCAAYPDRRGCLMINSIAQLGTRIPEVSTIGTITTTAMEQAVAEHLRRTPGSDTTDLSALSANIIVVAQGLIQLSRLGTTPERLRAVADVSCASLP